MKKRKTLIVTGGTVDLSFALSYIEHEKFDYFIAADAGIHFFVHSGIKPHEVLGDFDSADPGELSRLNADETIIFHRYQPEKDAVDTELALMLALKRASTEIHILGGTGTRLDHVLGTVHLLGIALEHHVPCFLADANNRLRLVDQKTAIKKSQQYGNYVSLIPLTTKVKGVTLAGFKYAVEGYTLDIFHSVGISNEIAGEEAVIDLEEGILIVIEARD